MGLKWPAWSHALRYRLPQRRLVLATAAASLVPTHPLPCGCTRRLGDGTRDALARPNPRATNERVRFAAVRDPHRSWDGLAVIAPSRRS